MSNYLLGPNGLIYKGVVSKVMSVFGKREREGEKLKKQKKLENEIKI